MIMLVGRLGMRWVLLLSRIAGRRGRSLQSSLLVICAIILAGFQVADALLQLLDALEQGLNISLR